MHWLRRTPNWRACACLVRVPGALLLLGAPARQMDSARAANQRSAILFSPELRPPNAMRATARRPVVIAALLGRAFARFETQLQLVWVLCGLLAVVVGFSLQAGDVLIGVTCAVAAGFHVSMRKAVLLSHSAQSRTGPADLPGAPFN